MVLLPVAGSGRRNKKEKTGPTEEKEKLTAGAVGVAEEGRYCWGGSVCFWCCFSITNGGEVEGKLREE